MDRGRAGGFITDNNFVMVKFNEKKRREHLHRLNKIKTRKPGSGTLDNNPPVIVKAALTNPRKVALKETFNFVTEQENKALLKRISSILVAPPKITDKEYQEMKKLCVSTTKGAKNLFEERIVQKKNQAFFENLKKTKPYYNAKSWEEDYKKQLFNQKFMRQVKYKRPPGFVDPFETKEENKEQQQQRLLQQPTPIPPKVRLLKPLKPKLTASHIDRIRAHKSKSHSSKCESPGTVSVGDDNDDDDQYGVDKDFFDSDEQVNIEIQVFEGNDEYDHDAFYQDGDTNLIPTESRLPMATISRQIRVLRESIEALGEEEQMYEKYEDPGNFMDAIVECVLVNRQYLVLAVTANDGTSSIQCEAELKASDLCMLSDSVYEDQIDPSSITELAAQMVESVELKIDKNGTARLVLNLLSEFEENDSKYDGDWDVTVPLSTADSTACATQEELQQMLLPDRSILVYACGVVIPVHFNNHAGMQTIGNIKNLIAAAQTSEKRENIYALLKIYGTPDDQLLVKALCINSTKHVFKRGIKACPAVQSGSTLTLSTPLPSIIQADPDMIVSFAENLSKNIKIEHDTKTGENNLLTSP